MTARQLVVATNSGDYGVASNSGTRGVASSSGDRGVASNSGDRGVASNSGYSGVATTDGKGSVAIAVGIDSRANGSLNCWLVLTDRDERTREIRDMRAVRVDGDQIKSDTFYQLANGQIVEVTK